MNAPFRVPTTSTIGTQRPAAQAARGDCVAVESVPDFKEFIRIQRAFGIDLRTQIAEIESYARKSRHLISGIDSVVSCPESICRSRENVQP